MADAWVNIRERGDAVWDWFNAVFDFRPSVSRAELPTFKEPSPSVTYNVADLLDEFYPWSDARATPYNLGLLQALRACVPEDEPVLALDWQHAEYEFFPHRFEEADVPANWCIPALPSGEYNIFVTADGRLGSLGHPWEESVCVFGAEFVTEYARHSPLGQDRIFRHRGAAT